MFIIKGKVQIGNQILNEKDGFGIYNIDNFDVEALEDAEILLMEVPMK